MVTDSPHKGFLPLMSKWEQGAITVARGGRSEALDFQSGMPRRGGKEAEFYHTISIV